MSDLQEAKYKHIHFVMVAEKPKTTVWSCRNNRSDQELGEVRWYSPWRQYCYFPTTPAVYSASCLDDIKSFIQLQNKHHRAALEAVKEK